MHLLRLAKDFDLDPLQEQLLLTQYEESWQVSISVDGWIQIMNRHPAFIGVSFTDSSEQTSDLPIWMECTINRSDRLIATTVREYLCEVKQDNEIWRKMPRRMLRHRALQQCARLALGISTPEHEHEHVQKNPKNQLTGNGSQANPFLFKDENLPNENVRGVLGLKKQLTQRTESVQNNGLIRNA